MSGSVAVISLDPLKIAACRNVPMSPLIKFVVLLVFVWVKFEVCIEE
ncbi:hypothetical protein BN938_0121 [Mucinivorans hirudinis]|uniref:Uncharacterized protein n=1 Tax=Mucinivorans hirudinis TaxID=1433126 RepID=A0A060R908_9BACT|nr:hypothetical protein BN938_0121 [Mucinivorans hirudinis]